MDGPRELTPVGRSEVEDLHLHPVFVLLEQTCRPFQHGARAVENVHAAPRMALEERPAKQAFSAAEIDNVVRVCDQRHEIANDPQLLLPLGHEIVAKIDKGRAVLLTPGNRREGTKWLAHGWAPVLSAISSANANRETH